MRQPRRSPDVARWQLANLLLLDESPMLWFFVRQRQEQSDAGFEARVNQAFLEQRFVCAKTSLRSFVRGADRQYRRAPASVAYPPAPENALLREIITRAAGRLTMREILDELDVDTRSRNAVASIRTGTTTAQFSVSRGGIAETRRQGATQMRRCLTPRFWRSAMPPERRTAPCPTSA